MKKYTDYSVNNETKDDRVLDYRSLRFSGDAMVYGSDGQAAYQARPVELPETQTEQQTAAAPEHEYRPMPSAMLFEDVGHVARRRRAPRALSAAVYIAVTLFAAVALFGLVHMYGEMNELTVLANDLTRELSELREEETRLLYRVNSEMTELDMLDYAEHTLNMEMATAANTVSVDFGGGDRYEIGSALGESNTLFGHISDAVENFVNYIG